MSASNHEHVFYWSQEQDNEWIAVFSGKCVTCDYYCSREEFMRLADFK